MPYGTFGDDKNRITDNTVLHASGDAIVVEGEKNVLMNNIVDGSIRIRGKGNVVVNPVFTRENAHLILEGEAAGSTVLTGVTESKIERI